MASKDRLEQARREGMSFCMRYLEEHDNDVSKLKEEVEKRGAYNIPVGLAKADADDFAGRVRHNVLDTVLVMSLLVLHDEFDFGTKRLNRFKARFNEKSECLDDGLTTWDDTLSILKDECGMELNIRWNGGDPSKENERSTKEC